VNDKSSVVAIENSVSC